jgi:transcriptional regulator with XRE-family HTH domain
MTLIDLSALTGLTPATLGSIEKNRSSATLESLRKLAQVLDAPLSYLGCFESLPEETLGQKIRKARHFLGLTKKEMALTIGVNARTVYDWECGKRKPDTGNMVLINDLLSVLLAAPVNQVSMA